jgi:hypothetical protein
MTTSVSKDLWNAEDMIKEGIKSIRKESEIPCVCVCVYVSYHLFSFHKSVQDYIIHMDMEIIIFVGIKG